jgi:two-component system, NtrC family, sensor kinase
VLCDPAQIEQVVLALVMNANDAMPRGGNLWLSTRVCDNTTELAIGVRDDGAGIPPDLVPHLFEPFLTTKENGKSVGLGLAVSHNIVEAHGGRIEVQSQLGKGTTFTVMLPLQAGGTLAPGKLRETGALQSR